MVKIPCRLCDSMLGSNKSLMKHMKQHPEATQDDYHYAKQDSRWYSDHDKLPAHLLEEELAHVGLGENRKRFECIACGIKMNKTSAWKHFRGKDHNIPDQSLKHWVVVKDGNLIRHSYIYTHLEFYFPDSKGDEHEHEDDEDGSSGGEVPGLGGDSGDPASEHDKQADARMQPIGVDQALPRADSKTPSDQVSTKITDPTRANNVGPSDKNTTRDMAMISMPGGSFSSMLLVPSDVAFELRATGFLEELEGERMHWNPAVPLDLQRSQLLELMPEGRQKQLLAQKFGVATGVANSMLTKTFAKPTAPQYCEKPEQDFAQCVLPTPGLPAGLDFQGMLSDLKSFVKSLVSGAPSIELQSLEIVKDFAEWTVPEEWRNKHRNNFPFAVDTLHDEDFNKFMEVRNLKKESREKYMIGLARFLATVRPKDGSKLDRPNILVNIFKSGLFEQLQALPILSDSYSCTRSLVVALGHFAVMSKLRFQAAGDINAAQVVDQVIDGHLKPWSKRCAAAHKEASQRKYMEDALLIAKYHKPDKLKQVALTQYLDLVTIHRAVCVEKTYLLTPQMLFKATACVITGFYTNAPPGRSMELQTLPRKTADDFLTKVDAEWFDFWNYKTVKVYGKGGKWVNAANRAALSLYRELIDTAPELTAGIDPKTLFFFQKQTISVATCLRSVSASERLDPPLRVNLQRKVFAVWAKLNKTTDNQGESAQDLFAKVARMDKHKSSTADNIYAAITPEEDARLAKHCFLRLMGDPVAFPSLSDWRNRHRTIEEIIARMPNQSDGTEADEEEEEEDEDFEELAGEGNEVDDTDDWADVLEADSGDDAQDEDNKNSKTSQSVAKAKGARKQKATIATNPTNRIAKVRKMQFKGYRARVAAAQNRNVSPVSNSQSSDADSPQTRFRFRIQQGGSEASANASSVELESLLDLAIDAKNKAPTNCESTIEEDCVSNKYSGEVPDESSETASKHNFSITSNEADTVDQGGDKWQPHDETGSRCNERCIVSEEHTNPATPPKASQPPATNYSETGKKLDAPANRYAVSENDEAVIYQCCVLARNRQNFPLVESQMRFLVHQYRLAHGTVMKVPDVREVREVLAEGKSKKVGILDKTNNEDQIKNFYRQFLKYSDGFQKTIDAD